MKKFVLIAFLAVVATACAGAPTAMPTALPPPVPTAHATPGFLAVQPTVVDRLANASWQEIKPEGVGTTFGVGNVQLKAYTSQDVVYVSVYKDGKWSANLGVDPRVSGGLRAGQATGPFSWRIISSQGNTTILSLTGELWALAVQLLDSKYKGAFFATW